VHGKTESAPRRARELRAAPGTPLYVHLPFCAAKCTYCDFYSLPADGQDLAGTLDGLLAEAERRAPREPRTVFLGGGTPSLYPIEDLERLLEGLERVCNFRSSAREVTCECNPESLDLEKARALRRLGVDRLSIGFQSLDPRVLTLFGRVHSAEQSLRAFAAAREAGFRRVSVDLIYASPGQELGAWERELERVLDLGPDHVSAYALVYEKGTLLGQWREEGRLEALPEERELEFFQATARHLEARGYRGYEVSNFCLSGQEALHNVNYWQNGPYVGLGPSAVTKLAHTRFGNPRSVHAWLAAIRRGEFPAAWEETLEPRERLGETWWLGLRMRAGVAPAVARRTAGFEEASDPTEVLATALVDQGLLEEDQGRFRLSERGWPLADAVARRFLQLEARAGQTPAHALAEGAQAWAE
jgi:oxygen-independent coproporphyrinogen-3 oxidase